MILLLLAVVLLLACFEFEFVSGCPSGSIPPCVHMFQGASVQTSFQRKATEMARRRRDSEVLENLVYRAS